MEIDGPAAAEEQEEQQSVQLQLSVLAIIKPAQLQNGLKHGDYARYRQYCARRLRSLYQAVKLLHGKGRYQKKKLDVQHITDVRHLHIILVSAERCWAHAMQVKKEAEADGAAAVPRKRQHAQRRLKKASVWAAELARFAAATCDTRSSLEAEAYAAWMAGNVLMERESDWNKALATFSKAKKLFGELAKVGPPEAAGLCGSMVEEIEPALRYCSYQIGRAGGRPADAAQLAALADPGGEGLGGGLLQSKLASLAAESQATQAAATSSFEWRGIRAAVSLERVRLPLHNAAEAAAALDNAMDADDVPIEQVLLSHDRLINMYAEGRAAARSAAKAAAAGATAGSSGAAAAGGKGAKEAAEAADVEELAALDKALSGRILDVAISRATAAAADAAARFGAALARGAAGGGGRGQKAAVPKGERPAKPDDLVRLFTTLSQLAAEQEELASHLGGRSGEALAAAAAARAAGYAAHRVYYAGHVALSSGDKWGEAAGLFRRARERAAAAVDSMQGLPKSEAGLASEVPGLQQLQAAARAHLLVAAAEAAAAGAVGAEAATKGMEGLGLAAAASQQQQQQYLYEALDSWQSFAGAGPSGSKGPRLYRGPYALAPIAPRPIMLDSAGGELAYPDVSHRGAKKAKRSLQQQGTFARLFGAWGS